MINFILALYITRVIISILVEVVCTIYFPGLSQRYKETNYDTDNIDNNK